MDLFITEHALERYRQRIDRAGTEDDLRRSVASAEIPPQWVIDLASESESFSSGTEFMVNGDALFVVEVGEDMPVLVTVMSMRTIRERRAFRARYGAMMVGKLMGP